MTSEELRAELAKEAAEPDFLFHMDGTPHYRESVTQCCGSAGRSCVACGGFQHYQPVYGGYYYKCETCGAENI